MAPIFLLAALPVSVGGWGTREAAAVLALDDSHRWPLPMRATAPVSVAGNLTVWPAGAQLPASFLAQNWADTEDSQKPSCLSVKEGKCDAFVFDADGDGKPEVLLVEKQHAGGGQVFAEGADGSWTLAASIAYRDVSCKPLVEKLRKGEFTLAAPRFKELQVGGRRVELSPVFQPEEEACEKVK